MKSVRVSTKALLAFIVTLILAVSFSVTAFAAERYENCGNRYGRIIPTDEKLDAQVFDYYFKGDSAPIHFMRMSAGEPGACYAVEIYADAEYTTLIKYLSREYDTTAGHSPVAINLSFEGLRSGTYYGRCYTYVTRSDGTIYDLDSIQNFNIHIDRLSNKTVVLSGAYNTDAGINVSWTPNATASQYHVYRKVNGYGDWMYVTTLGEGAYNYVDTDVYNGNTYTYTVRCSDGAYSSGFDTVGVTVARLSTPTLQGVYNGGPAGDVKVSWFPVEGADGYYVYRKGGSLSNYDWQLIADVQGGYSDSYIDTKAKSVSWYYNYTVVAYKGSSTSSYNPEGLEYSYMYAPSIQNAYNCNSGVYIEWSDNNRNTLGYNVYRKVAGGNWEFITSTENKNFVDTTGVSGVDYAYTVVAYCTTNESAYNNDGFVVRCVATPQVNEVWFDDYNNAVVSWNAVQNAEKYLVYRKLSYENDWVFFGETYDNYFYDTSEKYSGETYTYTVIAVSGNFSSGFDVYGKSGCFISAPQVYAENTFTWETPCVRVSWDYVNGAISYDVYRSDYGVGNWYCLSQGVTVNEFYDTTAAMYGGYSYAVVATNGYGVSKYNVSSLVALPTPVLEYAVFTDDGGVGLGWSAVEGANLYHIFRKTVNGDWVEIGISETNYYTDWSWEAVNDYSVYTVIADAYGYSSGFDAVGIANFAEVRNLNGILTEGEVPCITVNWELDEHTQWYELVRTHNGESVSIGVFSRDSGVTQYVDTDISIGNEYTYSITAGCDGKFNKTNSVTVKYPLPPVPAVTVGATNGYINNGCACVDITWSLVDYAEYYTVFRRTENSDWQVLATLYPQDMVNGSFYTDTTAEFDVNYYYTVVGYANNRESYYDNTGVSAVVLKPIDYPYGITVREDIINTKTVAVVGWDAVYNAEYYNIYRKENNGNWVYLNTVDSNTLTYIDENIVQDVKYTYTVAAGANGRGEAYNPFGVSYRWNIDGVGLVAPDYTGLYEYNGIWRYFENGKINYFKTTLVYYADNWYYVENGEINWDYTGLVEYNGTWYYVVNGFLDWNVTTLTYYNNGWYYVENGEINWNSNTLCQYAGDWYYVQNGMVNWNYTGLVEYYGVWYYVVNGYLDWNVTTLTWYNGEWYYVENGEINWNSNTLCQYEGGWYYVQNGMVNWNYTGLVEYYGVWYYVVNGYLDWNVTTLTYYYDVWYYVENGVLNWDSEAVTTYGEHQYYVLNGKVAWDYTGDVVIDNIMYRVAGGIVTEVAFDLNPVY